MNITINTNRQSVDMLTKRDLMEIIGAGKLNWSKSDMVEVAWTEYVEPQVKKLQQAKLDVEQAHAKQIEAEKTMPLVVRTRAGLLLAANNLLVEAQLRFDAEKVKCEKDFAYYLRRGADDGMLASHKKHQANYLVEFLSSDERDEETLGETLEKLSGGARGYTDRLLDESYSQSSSPLANIDETQERRAKSWLVKFINNLLKLAAKEAAGKETEWDYIARFGY